MLLPNQISNQRFSAVGKGGYRSSEVDAFVQRVYQNYNKLYNENNILKERLSSISPLIDEYNENKRAIADALIWAKTTSDKTVEQARQEAKELVENAASEGEKIIAEKTSEAQAVYSQELNSTKIALENAKTELEMTRNQAKSFSERYIAEINAKAVSIIEDANTNAAKIVADAYKDAQTARDKADAIINSANEQLAAIKAEASKLRFEIENAIKIVSEAVSGITIDEIEPEVIPDNEVITAKQIDVSDIEEFNFDFTVDMSEADDSDIDASEPFDIEASTIPELEVDAAAEDKTFEIEAKAESTVQDEDFISGGSSASAMPDVSAYISKIFDSAGSEGADFTSFTDGLNDVFNKSLEGSDLSFEDLKKAIENSNVDEEDLNDE